LLDLGHSKIAFLGGNIEIRSTEEKYKRYESLLAKRGMKYRRYIESPYTKEGGYRAVETLLEDAEIPTAVIMINEMAAVGAFKAFHERGIGIPYDVSMVCFDNTYISAIMRPALTTVGCNYECFGEKLVYTALDAMENDVSFKTTYVESVFVKRDSAISRELT
jgi:DNA-binding LacI/PurR family transcriptional regulator